MDYELLLWLAIILLFTKALGLLSEKARMPQVVGALLAGVILGPSCFNVMESGQFITETAEIGVLMLMFLAGLDTDLNEMKKVGTMALVIAVAGVLVPIALCGGIYLLFSDAGLDYTNILRALYLGTVFAATSVSISVETLNEMGKLKTKVGTAILGAAIIDDVVGIIMLSIIDSLANGGGSIGHTLLSIGMFFIFALLAGLGALWLFRRVARRHAKSRRIAVWALAFCFLMSYCAEEMFGVADITGAYMAGLVLCNLSDSRKFIAKKMAVASYVFFSPIFFASVGLGTNLRLLTGDIVLLTVLLLVAALLSKVVGCGAAAKAYDMSTRDSVSIGVGMMSRGEVGLMVAQKGVNCGMISASVFPAVIVVVVVSCLATPVFLKLSMSKPSPGTLVAAPAAA